MDSPAPSGPLSLHSEASAGVSGERSSETIVLESLALIRQQREELARLRSRREQVRAPTSAVLSALAMVRVSMQVADDGTEAHGGVDASPFVAPRVDRCVARDGPPGAHLDV